MRMAKEKSHAEDTPSIGGSMKRESKPFTVLFYVEKGLEFYIDKNRDMSI